MNQDRLTETNHVIPYISTDSASINTNKAVYSPQVNLLSIGQQKESSSPTMQLNSKSNGGEENTALPLIKYKRDYTQNNTIKQGLVLCTRTAEWYTKKKSTMREVQLRKTRLRWRQFKAVLKPNKIELYHVTTIIIAAERLAHVIHLNNQYPYRKVKLSLISAQDFIWCLEFLHYETKSLISYHFQSSSLSEARDWYMSVYRVLPCMTSCKKPIPPSVDIFVMLQTEIQQQIEIRIPLDVILNSNDDDTLLNIRISDIKPVILTLFKNNGIYRILNGNSCDRSTTIDDFRLCWRGISSSYNSGEGAASTANSTVISFKTPTAGDQIEWIGDNEELIGPLLIEQKHRLELRSSDPEDQSIKNITAITFDGLLIHKKWYTATTIYGKKRKCRNTYYFVILYGHHLFLLDKSYYYFYKRQKYQLMEKQQRNSTNRHMNVETNKRNHNWFSATTGGIHLQQKNTIFNSKKKREWQYVNRSTPNLTPSSTAINSSSAADHSSALSPAILINAKHLIDLNLISSVQPMVQEDSQLSTSNIFQIHIKNQVEVLYYEAPNTQTMLEWVTLINSKLKIDPVSLIGHYNGFQTYQSRPEDVKDILQSGFLYVKQDYKRSFQPQYCVLIKNQDGGGLLMFDMMKNKKQWWCHLNMNDDHYQQRERLAVYEKRRQLIQPENAYVYSGDECILDKLLTTRQSKNNEPSRYYKDGEVPGGYKTSECVFVIWQIAKRHFVPNFREYISLLKLGHRLGNRGSCWVFKARSRQERDEWVWALHQEFGVLKL